VCVLASVVRPDRGGKGMGKEKRRERRKRKTEENAMEEGTNEYM
jgi:hypothetical protein